MKRKAMLDYLTRELQMKRKQRAKQDKEFAKANAHNPHWRSKN